MPGQYINHFGQVRIRVTGSGVLESKLISLDGTTESPLADITMQSATPRFANLHSNFQQQRASLELRTTEFGASFLIRQIIFYLKPVGTNYPQ
jgi:hypothetical protein